jgi:hypothetical protein
LRVRPPHQEKCKETPNQECRNRPAVTVPNQPAQTCKRDEHFPSQNMFRPTPQAPDKSQSNQERCDILKYELGSDDSVKLKVFEMLRPQNERLQLKSRYSEKGRKSACQYDVHDDDYTDENGS